MALQTNVFQGGQWVTQTVDLNTILQANTDKGKTRSTTAAAGPPTVGILSKTLVETPVVNWVLPARLRSANQNDVAFISDRCVDVREFKSDGQLYDVIRKTDFESRIRNACVLGTISTPVQSEGSLGYSRVKSEEPEDVEMGGLDALSPSRSHEASDSSAQALLLVLESGESIFLIVHQTESGHPTITTANFKSPAPAELLVPPGFHVAVDPSSRYAALSSAESLFVVYQLESVDALHRQASRGEKLQPVLSYHPRSVHGVIHKMAFLYPSPGNRDHIILLLIVVRDHASRMAIYEWEVGDDFKAVLSEEKAGHRMPMEHQLPLLVIPLTVRSAFFAISETAIAVCTDILPGTPSFDVFEISPPPASECHVGREAPLWTAWTRPFRLPRYSRRKDCIYLAREDGYVLFLEVSHDSALEGSISFDQFGCTIYNAFCSVFEPSSDILIMCGDSSPGQIWKAGPRSRPVFLGTLPNWSPTLDFVIADDSHASTKDREIGATTGSVARTSYKPGKLFATSGRGIKGSVAEIRHGLAAKIGLVLDCEPAVRQAWLFPNDAAGSEEGYYMLFSAPDRSSVLYLSEDLSEVTEPAMENTPFDLSSRTVAAGIVSGGRFVQVTTTSTNILHGTQNIRITHDRVLPQQGLVLADAAIHDSWIGLAAYKQTQFQVHVLSLESLHLRYQHSFPVDGEITCMTIALINNRPCVIAGLWTNHSPYLAFFSMEKSDGVLKIALKREDLDEGDADAEATTTAQPSEPLTTVALMATDHRSTAIVVGSRNGEVLTSGLREAQAGGPWRCETFGVSSATVLPIKHQRKPSVLVLCDQALTLMSNYDARRALFQEKLHVWPVDAGDLPADSPTIDSLTIVEPTLSDREDASSLLLLSGGKALLAELQPLPGPVPRQIAVGGTPTRIRYSPHLGCLIVAVDRHDRPTLLFLDPRTGQDLSKPTNRDGEAVDYISGLGNFDDKIFGLDEWEYGMENRIWRFILLSTRQGRLLVVSTAKTPAQQDEMGISRVRFWTRWKETKTDGPIFSVLGLRDGIAYCVGETLHWDRLDAQSRKLVSMKTFALNSPATSIRTLNDKLVVLTARDGLQIIDHYGDDATDEMTLLHVDYGRRGLVHLIEAELAADSGTSSDPGSSSPALVLVSNRDCRVAGLFVPWKTPGRDCEVVFEAELPASIRKFQRGRTLPAWLSHRPRNKYGAIASVADGGETLGLCLDGSLYHFTLLSMEAWELLRFIQNAALASTETPCGQPATKTTDENAAAVSAAEEDANHPRADRGTGMHVDGDLLQRCLDERSLEQIIQRPGQVARLAELLDEIDDGRWTAAFSGGEKERKQQGFWMAYDILEHYLAPVL